MKWGNISAQKLETECLKGLLCEFRCKPKPSGISLETQGVENIPQIPGNLAEVGQNHHVRNHCEQRQAEVRLESQGLENIL